MNQMTWDEINTPEPEKPVIASLTRSVGSVLATPQFPTERLFESSYFLVFMSWPSDPQIDLLFVTASSVRITAKVFTGVGSTARQARIEEWRRPRIETIPPGTGGCDRLFGTPPAEDAIDRVWSLRFPLHNKCR